MSAFTSLVTFPVGQKFADTLLVFGSIKSFNYVSGSLPKACPDKLKEFGPISSDRTAVKESA